MSKLYGIQQTKWVDLKNIKTDPVGLLREMRVGCLGLESRAINSSFQNIDDRLVD